MKFGAIITAGGSSTRFGSNKLLEKISGKTIIEYSVEAFLNSGIDEIVICCGDDLLQKFGDSSFASLSQNDKIKIVKGGQTRQESVYNGLMTINCDYVLIHDAARPMITPEIIEQVKKEVVDKKAVSVMTKTIDTIKEVDQSGKIIKTIDRSKLYNTQTPQAFEYNLIKSVHEKIHNDLPPTVLRTTSPLQGAEGNAQNICPLSGGNVQSTKGVIYTDDCSMLEALGYDVYIVEGDYKNIKITYPSDIELAKVYLK